jgi:hypothetical protein
VKWKSNQQELADLPKSKAHRTALKYDLII